MIKLVKGQREETDAFTNFREYDYIVAVTSMGRYLMVSNQQGTKYSWFNIKSKRFYGHRDTACRMLVDSDLLIEPQYYATNNLEDAIKFCMEN